MSDQAAQKKGGTSLTIPTETQTKFADLIDLIVRSESMNDEERQYWINILSIMTPDQIANLKEILVNERKQLDAIDKKYAKEIEQIGQEQLIKKIEEERTKRRDQRKNQEERAESADNAQAEDLLKQMEEV